MNNRRILLAEDDSNLGVLLSNYLNVKGFETSLCKDGKEALEIFTIENFSLCILDIMMPEMDGLALASEIRKLNSDIPIIFLTAKNQKEDIIDGFIIGADDYITKPFSMEELIYRIEAILRRTSAINSEQSEESHKVGAYTFVPLKQLLLFQDQCIKLTTKESELFLLLCKHKNEILERNYALKTIWVDDNYFNARSMDVYITKLRKFLKNDPSVEIINIHGKGYKLLC
jgi:two-component system, OmpR family, response regulator